MTYSSVSARSDRQDEDPLQLRQQQEKPFDINEAFDFSQNSDKLRHPSKDGTAELHHVNADNYVSFDTSLGINSTIASPSHAIAFLSASLPRPYCASLDSTTRMKVCTPKNACETTYGFRRRFFIVSIYISFYQASSQAFFSLLPLVSP
jgi:hypothetical protein